MSVIVKEISSHSDMKRFVKFYARLYKKNKFAVPAIIVDELSTLNKKKNPAFDFCEVACFLAYRDKKIVGRIAAIINHEANAHNKHQRGRFGWFDFIDDEEVSTALLKTAETWVKGKGMDTIMGPMGITDLDREGMLISGFDRIGTLSTNYNFPYYPEHMEALGYVKDVDWNEYRITIPKQLPEKFSRVAAFVSEKFDVHPITLKSKKEITQKYGHKLFDLWNICYAGLYGVSLLTEKQIQHYIKMYFFILRADCLSIVVDRNDNVVGFGVSMPSFSKALIASRGALFPFGIFRLLKAYFKNDTVDLQLIGVHPDYQNKGIVSLIFQDIFQAYIKNGYKFAESNPELEANVRIISHWDAFEHENHKHRRSYIKFL